MGKKRKRKGSGKRQETEQSPFSYRPFAKIDRIKPEKLSSSGTRKKRRSGPVVGGYDKDADFGSILRAWEAGIDPSKVKKREEGEQVIIEDNRPFSEIFAEWEGKPAPSKKSKKNTAVKKSPAYRDTRSFGEILAEFEGSKKPAAKKAAAKKPSKKRKQKRAEKPVELASEKRSSHKTPEGVKSFLNGFGEDASFGDILAEFENSKKPAVKKAAAKKPSKKRKQKRSEKPVELASEKRSSHKTPEGVKSVLNGFGEDASFGDILAEFENSKKPAAKKAVAKKPSQKRKQKRAEKPVELASEKRSSHKTPEGVKSVLNGFGEDASFGDILSEFENSKKAEAKKPAQKRKPKKAEKPVELASEKRSNHKTPEGVKSFLNGFGEDFSESEDKLHRREVPRSEIDGESSFGAIYKQWTLENDESSVIEKIASEEVKASRPAYTISRLRAMLPQATLDLHGLTAEEAKAQTEEFLSECELHRLVKVALIPGKGIHNAEGKAVLKPLVERVLESHKGVREFYAPKTRYGGSGAIWVILKG